MYACCTVVNLSSLDLLCEGPVHRYTTALYLQIDAASTENSYNIASGTHVLFAYLCPLIVTPLNTACQLQHRFPTACCCETNRVLPNTWHIRGGWYSYEVVFVSGCMQTK